jgi:hypothetical protein
MTDELFTPAEVSQLSPKLAWLQANQLATRRLESGRWECSLNEENFARGEDEEEAVVALCIKMGLEHYSQR